ncbi:hypothetical protein GA0115233_101339 [Streptomyces sp. DI166]|nr:hypothetical protein GA0115233_101339 [Streptomyces sp. DI166]
MTPFLVPLTVALLIVAASTALLIRRDRRSMSAGPAQEPPRRGSVTVRLGRRPSSSASP